MKSDPSARQSIAELFERQWDGLTRTDRKIAHALLADYPVAGLQTLVEVAESAGVSAPSVMRCVNRLGFEGYADFQRALCQEVRDRLNAPAARQSRSSASELPSPLREEFDDISEGLLQTFRANVPREMTAFARLLADGRLRLLCTGTSFTHLLAQYLHRRLLALRPNCELLSSEPLERSQRLLDVGRRDAIVVFDFVPYDADSLQFVRLAIDRGARAVLFTDLDRSPLREHAEHVVVASATSRGRVASLAPALAIVETVIDQVEVTIGRSAEVRLQQLRESFV